VAAAHGVAEETGEFVRGHPAVVPTSHLFEKPAAGHGRAGFELRRGPRTSDLVIASIVEWRAVEFLYVVHLPALSLIAIMTIQ